MLRAQTLGWTLGSLGELDVCLGGAHSVVGATGESGDIYRIVRPMQWWRTGLGAVGAPGRSRLEWEQELEEGAPHSQQRDPLTQSLTVRGGQACKHIGL